MEGCRRWCSEESRGGRETRCPKGVFRNRGKMEENRYSLVAGKSRVERAERGRNGGGDEAGDVETPLVERGRFVRTHTEAHAHPRAFALRHTHTHEHVHGIVRPSV